VRWPELPEVDFDWRRLGVRFLHAGIDVSTCSQLVNNRTGLEDVEALVMAYRELGAGLASSA